MCTPPASINLCMVVCIPSLGLPTLISHFFSLISRSLNDSLNERFSRFLCAIFPPKSHFLDPFSAIILNMEIMFLNLLRSWHYSTAYIGALCVLQINSPNIARAVRFFVDLFGAISRFLRVQIAYLRRFFAQKVDFRRLYFRILTVFSICKFFLPPEIMQPDFCGLYLSGSTPVN
jgi:hypothetical protein